MSKLKEKELLKELVGMKKHSKAWTILNPQKIEMAWSKKREQAYQQIKEMIQSDAWRKVELSLERNERLKTQIKGLKADYKWALSKIPEMPEITEEFIEEKAKEAWNLWWYKASGKYIADFTGTIRFDFQGVKNLIRSLVEEIK